MKSKHCSQCLNIRLLHDFMVLSYLRSVLPGSVHHLALHGKGIRCLSLPFQGQAAVIFQLPPDTVQLQDTLLEKKGSHLAELNKGPDKN